MGNRSNTLEILIYSVWLHKYKYRMDDEIYGKFRQAFPDLSVEVISDEILKSKEAKEKWRPFLMEFKHLDMFNFLTLLR